jgi:subtilisin
MAQEKEERPGAAAKKIGDGGDDSMRRAAGTQSRSSARETGNGGDGGLAASPPGRRRERYIIGMRTLPGAQAGGQAIAQLQHSMDEVVQYLNRQENVEVVKRIRLGGTQPFTADGRSVNEVVVAKIDEVKARRLRALAPPHLIIERDSLLACADYQSVPTRVAPIGTLLPLRSVATDISIRVIGERDQPLARATVVIDGGELPAQALTDETGTARITFFGSSTESIRALFIRSAANHWDRVIPAPRLSAGINTVKLRPLAEVFPNFPATRLLGWGQRLMGIDPTAGRFTGSGVKIGLIDSGCDNSHPLLRHIVQGKDFTNSGTDTSWTQDLVSHGTHCAGIINASSTEQGIVGCAPAAELHVFKVIPEGRVSDLLSALDECIERELDLINISVVSDEFSELLSQKLQEVRQKGIACIVAAGNSGGPLAFPATLPGVMAVAAVGKLKEFPADSSHALSVIPQLIGNDNIFPANFSGWGPQVAVSGPGVAVVSTVPGGGYAAADGTSAAAAHLTGLAALVLAHHPLLQEGVLRVRSEQRFQAVFELLRASAVPHFPDPLRGGAGVPDLSRIPGGQSSAMGPSFPDGTERAAMSASYWPLSAQGWPTWLLQTRAPLAGFF